MKIEKNLGLWVGILLVVSLIGGVNSSSSSTTLVNFTVNHYNESENNSFSGHVVDLRVEDISENSISWIWENSEDEGFSYNLVFLDSYLVMNGTEEIFEAVGLSDDECYEISIISIGEDGSEGPLVSDIACTFKVEEEDEEEIRRSGKSTSMKNSPIPNFFVNKNELAVENVVIDLDCSWFFNF